eukprot:TRINITY_DN7784_c0_g1_i1.p5 TRINITY_DN7784_c0_g1~~TRINITY_DN7784_c0_g1_i1.p5  ORF type:complete len:50 (+),score=9.35 TRINITY_DN7784_c0_g1_i1:83-232(+)
MQLGLSRAGGGLLVLFLRGCKRCVGGSGGDGGVCCSTFCESLGTRSRVD